MDYKRGKRYGSDKHLRIGERLALEEHQSSLKRRWRPGKKLITSIKKMLDKFEPDHDQDL